MRQTQILPVSSAPARKLFVKSLLCAAMLMFAAFPAFAQSNRHAQRPSADSSRDGGRAASTPSPESQQSNAETQLRYALHVVTYVPTTINSLGVRTAFESFSRWLQRSPHLNVMLGGEMNRAEAIRRARAETDIHIVWLQLSVDTSGVMRSDNDESVPQNWAVDYTVFEPRTARIRTQGRVHQYATRAPGMIVLDGASRRPTVTVGGSRVLVPRGHPDDIALRRMGREAADRIVAAFDLPPVEP